MHHLLAVSSKVDIRNVIQNDTKMHVCNHGGCNTRYMYHLKVVAANIAYLATEFFPKKEGMEKMERHFFAVRALVGY